MLSHRHPCTRVNVKQEIFSNRRRLTCSGRVIKPPQQTPAKKHSGDIPCTQEKACHSKDDNRSFHLDTCYIYSRCIFIASETTKLSNIVEMNSM